MTQLPDWLAHRAALSPDQLALIARHERLTYGELERRVAGTAGRLAAEGIRPGDAVGIVCGNTLPYAVLAHAIPRLGAILVPVNTRLHETEVRYQVEDVGARTVIADAERAGILPASIPGLQRLAAEAVTDGGWDGEPIHGAQTDLAAPRAIIYTSGTTGRPKGAVLTHGNFWYSAIGSALNLGLAPDDRWLAVLPLFHVGGLSILYRCTIYGIPAVLHERFDAAAVNRAIDEGVTIVSVVSTMLQRMLDEHGSQPFPPSLRCVLLGGGPAPLGLLQRCAALNVPAVQTYGLTETASQVATLAPAEALIRLGSAGKPLMTAEMRIEIEGREARPGEDGEILVRGPVVTPGYVNRVEETAEALAGGWFHTGDIGHLDAEGYLYVLDRRSDLIVTGGENVYPAEIERVLLSHPAVADAGAFGVWDEQWGQAVAAAIVARAGAHLDESSLRSFCRERLAPYKVPRRFVRTDSLPRNAGGKLLRRTLVEQFGHVRSVPDSIEGRG